MKGFLAFSIVVFWLTSLPLQGFLLKYKKLFLIFLLSHSLSYFVVYAKYEYFQARKFLSILAFPLSLLTLLYPFASYSLKVILIFLMGLISSPLLLSTLSQLKSEGEYLWPFTSLIFGNLLTYILQALNLPSFLCHTILAILIFSIFFLINRQIDLLSDIEHTFNRADQLFIFTAIFIFYLNSVLIYEWLNNKSNDFTHIYNICLIFYSLGILFSLFLIKENLWNIRGIFITSPVVLSIANASLSLEFERAQLIGKVLAFLSSGIMDFITLFFFISFFKNLKKLALLYGIISSSLLVSQIIFSWIISSKEYYFSFLSLNALFTLLLLYKVNFPKKYFLIEEDVYREEYTLQHDSIESKEKSCITVDTLFEKLNNSLPSIVKRLSRRECEVLYHYVINEKSLSEVAEILQISRSSAKEYLRRACLKLNVQPYELKDFLQKILS